MRVGRWQFKTGYNHLSSHMGDEIMMQQSSLHRSRINYVRDSLMLGVGYFATDNMRLFGEVDYGWGRRGRRADRVAIRHRLQPGPSWRGAVLGLYTNLRQEFDFGGFFVAQAGWQWRGGLALRTLRIGFEYFNGKSPQWETFNHVRTARRLGCLVRLSECADRPAMPAFRGRPPCGTVRSVENAMPHAAACGAFLQRRPSRLILALASCRWRQPALLRTPLSAHPLSPTPRCRSAD